MRKLLALLGFLLAASPAFAQQATIFGNNGGGGSITCGTGITGCPAGPLSTTVTNNAQTGTTYAVLAADGGKIVSASNSSSEAYSIAAANTTGFTAGFGFDLHNIGAGVTTLTATTSLFDNGLTTLPVVKGQDAFGWSDGANYHTMLTLPTMAADTVLGNFSGTAGQYPVASGALSSCSAASSALTYNTTTHAFGCNTISGSGSPGGSDTQLQFNNAGSFGGISTLAWSGSALTYSQNAASSAPALVISGDPFLGTGTTSTPLVMIGSGAAATTWSTNGTVLGMNSKSGSGASFLDFHINGAASVFAVGSAGNVVMSSTLTVAGNILPGATAIISWNGRARISSSAASKLNITSTAAAALTQLTLGPETSASFAFGTSGTTLSLIAGDASIPTYASCTALTTNASGVIGCTVSDERLKNDEGVIDGATAIAAINGIDPHAFTYKNASDFGADAKNHMGFFAQDVQKFFPKIITRRTKESSALAPDGQLEMDKNELLAVAWAAIKYQQSQIDDLKRQIAAK